MSTTNTLTSGDGGQQYSALHEAQQRGADKVSQGDIRGATADIVGASAEVLKKEASELAGVAKAAVAEAGDRLQSQVDRQKHAGADYVERFADTMRRAAGEFETDTPTAATYIRKAAEQLESAADAVRQGDFRDLLRGAQSFAQRQPTAFLGLAVLAGFGAVRFLKSASTQTQMQARNQTQMQTPPQLQPNTTLGAPQARGSDIAAFH